MPDITLIAPIAVIFLGVVPILASAIVLASSRNTTAEATTVAGASPIALTAYAREDDRQKALKAGFNRHVAKPVKPVDLVEILAELLGETEPRTGTE